MFIGRMRLRRLLAVDEHRPRGRRCERYTVEVVATHPHDADAFTQGLVMTEDGRLFESVGGFGESQVREVELETGEVIRSSDLDDDLFGEGLAQVGDELVQLTWQDGVGDPLGASTTSRRWVATSTRVRGGGSRPTATSSCRATAARAITARDAATFEPIGPSTSSSDTETIDELNELEVVDGRAVRQRLALERDRDDRPRRRAGVVRG